MKCIFYILLLVLSCSSQGNAQGRYTSSDSLYISKLLDSAQALTDKAQYTPAAKLCKTAFDLSHAKGFGRGEGNACLQLADIAYQEGDYPNMKRNDSIALSIGTRLQDTTILAAAYEIAGLYEMDKGSKSMAVANLNKALSLQYEKEQSSNTARIYIDLGLLNSNDKETATTWYLKGIHLYEKAKDEEGLSSAYSNYSTHLLSLDRKDEALSYAKKAMLIRERLNDDYGLMYSYANISQIYMVYDSLERALYYQQKSVSTAEQIGSVKLKAQSYVGLSLLYSKMEKYDLSFAYESKAVQLLEQDGSTEMLSRRYIAMAMAYDRKKDPAMAISYYNKAINLAEKYNYKENLRDAYLYTAISYKNRKDFYNAYEYLKKYIKVRDEIADEETVATIAELETKYETQKKEEQIRQLNNEKLIQDLKLDKQRLFRNILIVAIIIALTIAYILFSRYQLKKKLEQKTVMLKERSRISGELHDEVGSTLSTINILSHSARMKLRTDMEKSDSLLEKINENSQRMMDAMSDIVWSINPENDALGNISVRMKEFASEILDGKNIDYSFTLPEDLMEIKLSPEIRKDLYLVFKEAVNNLAKYSKATQASISIDRQDGKLNMLIQDNGTGFDQLTFTSGNGMMNMKKRAESHGGIFKIVSEEGKGTLVSMVIPIA